MGSYALNWNSNGRDRLTADDKHRIATAFNSGFGEVELAGKRVAYLDDDNTSIRVTHPDTHQHSLVGSLDYVAGTGGDEVTTDDDGDDA